jgi:predicted CopG family antitoxin
MRTTLTLSDDVYEAVKTLAEGSGRSMGEVISELARRALQPRHDAELLDGLPVFAVPPNSEVIPGSRAAELLASEGVE